MKKLLSLFVLLVAIVTGASADTEWVMKDWSTGHAGLTYWASGASADIPSTSTDKNVPAWADESTYNTYTGTGGSSNFQWDTSKDTWKSSNPNRVWSFDVNANDVIKVYFMGGGSGNRSMYVSYNASGTNRDTNTAFGSATADGYTPTILSATATTAGTVYLWCDTNVRVYAIKVKSGATTAPTITTDLPATADVTVGVAEGFSIVATGATSYQWYNGENAIEGATSATYSYTATTAGTVNLKCVATNSIGSTSSTVCAVTATAPANPPVITTDLSAAYNVNKGSTLELSIVAEDASSYQWYVDGAAVAGATSDSYTYSATTIGSVAVYCAATNAAGTTNSATATVTTVGRADCKLLQVKYSNNFYAFIKQPTTEKPDDPYTITSYYLEGETAPTIESESVIVSDGATWAVAGNTLTVTAEDGTTKAEFTINTPVAVSPYTGLGEYTFTATDAWVKTGYAFDTASGKKGWKFSKNDESDGKLRNADGRTRIYLFVGPCKTIKLTSGCGSDRDIRVYRNGTEVLAKTKLAKNGGTVTFDGDEDNAAMYEVRSAQTGGDGSIEKITIATSTEPVAIPSEGVATYVTKQALDFSTQNGTIKAYAVTAVSTTSATTAVVGQVPAGTPLLVKGAEGSYDIEVIASAEAITNLLLASDGTVQGGDNIYAYSKSALKFKKVSGEVTIPAGKAYLQTTAGDALDIVFEDEATAVDAIAEASEAEAAPVKVIKNGKLYIGNFNVAGQQVK